MTIRNRNEVLQGPSPACLRVLKTFPATKLATYLDGYDDSLLRRALARRYRFPVDQVIIDEGIESLLRKMFDAMRWQRKSVLTSEYHYYYYSEYFRRTGIRSATFRMPVVGNTFTFDVEDAVRQIRRRRPGLVLFATPNNPTGNVMPLRDIRRIIRAAPSTTIIAIDEAYLGFDPAHDERPLVDLARRHPNVVLFRTFSKLYALAGLRVGYGLCGRDVQRLFGYQGQFLGFNRVSEAVALVALRSSAYYRRLVKTIIRDRERFVEAVNRLKHIRAFRSRTNFVFVRFAAPLPDVDRRREARFSPAMGKWMTPTDVRVTVGYAPNTRRYLALLRDIDRRWKS